MTISSTNRKAGPFIGNDSASVFPFAFSVFSAADVYAVQLNTVTSDESPLTLGVDYTVTLNADQSANPGGTLTLTAGPLATGLTLTLTTAVTPLQLTDLTNQGGFYPRVITRAFDKLTVLAQQILERLGRSLTLPLSTSADVSTALPVPEANKALVWNSTATGLANYDASQFATSVIGTNRVVDRFLANGTAGPYTLSADPLNINNTLVFVGGDYRAHNTYTVSGASITFDGPVVGGTVVEVVQQLAVTYPVTALSDNVVSTGKVVDGAITLTKLSASVQNLINGALQRSGGTMTGALTLSADASASLEPVTLQQMLAMYRVKAIKAYTNADTGTTYTRPTDVQAAIVAVQAPGGGSGGGPDTTSSYAGSPGGSSGAYAVCFLTAAQIGASQTLTIPAGGTAGASGSSAGGNGGTASFGSVISCPGGRGSSSYGPTATTVQVVEGAARAGAPSTTGVVMASSPGNKGGAAIGTISGNVIAGSGAPSPMMGEGGYGAGADGTAQGASASAVVGNAGQGGFILVVELG